MIEMEPAYTRIFSFFPVSGSEGIPTILTRRCTRIARCEGYSPSAGPRPISTHARIRIARRLIEVKAFGIAEFQLTHVYGLQGHGINPSSCFALRICFRKLHPKDAPSRSTQVRFAQIVVSCWTYFLPGFYRAVPVISTPALLSSGRSKRTRLCCYPIL